MPQTTQVTVYGLDFEVKYNLEGKYRLATQEEPGENFSVNILKVEPVDEDAYLKHLEYMGEEDFLQHPNFLACVEEEIVYNQAF